MQIFNFFPLNCVTKENASNIDLKFMIITVSVNSRHHKSDTIRIFGASTPNTHVNGVECGKSSNTLTAIYSHFDFIFCFCINALKLTFRQILMCKRKFLCAKKYFIWRIWARARLWVLVRQLALIDTEH